MDLTQIATISFHFFRDTNGELVAGTEQPDVDTDCKYEYVKLALMAAEIDKYIKDQVIVANLDEGGLMKKLADTVVDEEGWQEAVKKRQEEREAKAKKKLADVDKHQTKFEFEGTQTEPNPTHIPREVAEDIRRQEEADDWADNGFDDGED